jgi:hypothetical protein
MAAKLLLKAAGAAGWLRRLEARSSQAELLERNDLVI